MVLGQKFVVRGQKFVVRGQKFVVRGQKFVVRGQKFVVRGQKFVVRGQKFVVRGQKFVVRGQKFVVRGPGRIRGSWPGFVARGLAGIFGVGQFQSRNSGLEPRSFSLELCFEAKNQKWKFKGWGGDISKAGGYACANLEISSLAGHIYIYIIYARYIHIAYIYIYIYRHILHILC